MLITSPEQKEIGAVIFGIGFGLMVSVVVAVAVQLLAFVTVTVYEPATLVVILGVVSPDDQS
jgi:hypothetical protein